MFDCDTQRASFFPFVSLMLRINVQVHFSNLDLLACILIMITSAACTKFVVRAQSIYLSVRDFKEFNLDYFQFYGNLSVGILLSFLFLIYSTYKTRQIWLALFFVKRKRLYFLSFSFWKCNQNQKGAYPLNPIFNFPVEKHLMPHKNYIFHSNPVLIQIYYKKPGRIVASIQSIIAFL